MHKLTFSRPQSMTRTKHWLPYFVIAAIVINSFIFLILIDLFNITTMSISIALDLPRSVTPVVRSVGEREPLRWSANTLLIGAFLLVAARDLRERKNVSH